jgi:hypothetical protein
MANYDRHRTKTNEKFLTVKMLLLLILLKNMKPQGTLYFEDLLTRVI